MAKITESIPSFTGGISTQPIEYRTTDQVDDMLNCFPSLATGVARRPPFTIGASINQGNQSDRCAYHFITGVNNDDPDDFHVAVIRPNSNSVLVYNRHGFQVNVAGSLGSVSVGSLSASLQTVASETFSVGLSSRIFLAGTDFESSAVLDIVVDPNPNFRVIVGLVVENTDLTESVYLPGQLGDTGLESKTPSGPASLPPVAGRVDYTAAIAGFSNFEISAVRIRVAVYNESSISRDFFYSALFDEDPTVSFGILDYLSTPDPRRDIRFLTVRNRVYVVNTAVTVLPSEVRSADRGNELLAVANSDPGYNSLTRMAHVHEGTLSNSVQAGWSKSWYIRAEGTSSVAPSVSTGGVADFNGGATRMFQHMLDHVGPGDTLTESRGFVSSERSPNDNLGKTVSGFRVGAPVGFSSWAVDYTYDYIRNTMYVHKDRLATRRETEADTLFGIDFWSSDPELFTVIDSRGARSVDLPSTAFPGMVVRVNQASPGDTDPATALDAYFVRFVPSGEGSTSLTEATLGFGSWEESVGPSVSRGVDSTTMPIILSRVGSSYTISGANWTPRSSGDERTVPDPSFVGNRIGGLAYFGGRLAILSTGSVSLSAQDDNLSFYRASLLANLATDPIDLSIEAAGEEPLHSSLPVGGALMVFGRTQQFLLSAVDGTLSPETAILRPVAEYASSPSVTPAVYGDSVLFAAEIGDLSVVNLASVTAEYSTETVDVSRLTGHVSDLIPSGLAGIVASATFGFAAAYEELGNRMWSWHEYIQNDGTIVQRAWSRWHIDVPWKIALAQIINGNLWLIYTDPDTGVLNDFLVSASLFEGVRGATTNSSGYRDYMAGADIDSRMTLSPLVPRDPQGGHILDASIPLSALHLSLFKTRHTEVSGRTYEYAEPTAEVVTVPIRGDARGTRVELVNTSSHPSSWVSASWSGSYTPR